VFISSRAQTAQELLTMPSPLATVTCVLEVGRFVWFSGRDGSKDLVKILDKVLVSCRTFIRPFAFFFSIR
jgi:hypothetical protein